MSQPSLQQPHQSAGIGIASPVFECSLSRGSSDASQVKVAGELDLASAPQLTAMLRDALRDTRLVVLDLSDLTFLDSAGAHAIVNASIAARQDGRQLLVAHATDRIERVFALTSSSASLERFVPEPPPQLKAVAPPARRIVAAG